MSKPKDKNPRDLYVRRVENGTVISRDDGIYVFTDDKDLQRFIGEMYVIPEEKNIEYKITITIG